jgi:TRAP-type C4-dicarboxylate transport system substrate-binding protein
MIKTMSRIGLGVVLTAAMAVSASAQNLDFKPVSFKIISGTLGTPGDILMKKVWNDMAGQTGGKVSVRVQSRTELGLKGPEVYRMAKLGVAEVSSTAMQYAGGDLPYNDGVDITGLITDMETGRKVADAWLPYIKKNTTEKVGVELLGLFPIVAQVVWCAVPISGIDDLKGKKVRVSGVALGKLINGLGAVATTIGFREVVPSLQRKVIDCAVTGTTSGNLNKWPEVATHLYPLVTGWAFQGVYANKKWWAGLEANARKFITDTFTAMYEEGWERAGLETNHGIWCSVGDKRCDVNVPLKPLKKFNLKLVKKSSSDQDKVSRVAEKVVLPDFAKRCGKACATDWNNSVGKILGVKAVAP